MSRKRAWLINGLLLFGALAVALMLTEAGLRLFAPQPTGLSHQDRYGLDIHWPGITRHLAKFGTTASFNSVGMRDREHTFEKPAGVYRILVLGDSFMEALQVEFEASLPSLVEQRLSAQTGKRVEVINAGVSGWGTADELRYLTEYGLRYQPDLVLVAMTLHNDVSDNLREVWFGLKDSLLVEHSPLPMSPIRYQVVQLKAFIATRFQSYQLWRRVRHRGEMQRVGADLNRHIVELFWEPPNPTIVRGYRLTELLLARTDSVARAHGARMAVVLLPLTVQLSDSSFAEFVRLAGSSPARMPPDKPQRLMTTTAQRLGAPVIDLLPAFREWAARGGASTYLEFDGHWNAAGHRLAAEVVTRALLEAGVPR